MPGLYRRIEGKKGRIDIVDLGATAGEFVSWTLNRRGNVDDNPKDPEGDLYDLHAVLRFITTALLEDPDYRKQVVIFTNRRKSYTLEPREPGHRMAVHGHSFTMERVALVPND